MGTRWWRRGADRIDDAQRCPRTRLLTRAGFLERAAGHTLDEIRAAHAVVAVEVLEADRLDAVHGAGAHDAALSQVADALAGHAGVDRALVGRLDDHRVGVALHALEPDAVAGRGLGIAWALVGAVRLDVAAGVATSAGAIDAELLTHRAELSAADAASIGSNVTRLYGVRFRPSLAAAEAELPDPDELFTTLAVSG